MVYSIGIDVGSTSVNTVVFDLDNKVVNEHYDYAYGKPFHVLYDRLMNIFSSYPPDKLKSISFTGTGGKKAVELLGGIMVNEIIAQSTAAAELHPEARTIIEMGGEDSKLIFMENGRANGQTYLSDFAMNSLCAAGTGSFLDQQGKRIGVKIDKEFGELSLKSETPPVSQDVVVSLPRAI